MNSLTPPPTLACPIPPHCEESMLKETLIQPQHPNQCHTHTSGPLRNLEICSGNFQVPS